MAIESLGAMAQYNVALEVLRQTLRQEQRTAGAIVRAQEEGGQALGAPSGAEAAASGADSPRGSVLDILA